MTTAAQSGEQARTYGRGDGIDLFAMAAGLVVFAAVLFLPAILNDGDTLWQIRTGEWILGHRAIPAIDPFSFTAGQRPWSPHEWLAETLMALAFRAGGMAGVMILAAAAAGTTAFVLLRCLRRFLPEPYAVLGVILAFSVMAPSLLARPHELAWPCMALWTEGLVMARAGRRAPHWTLLPVMTLWVNLHGSFMLGLVLPGAFLLEALIEPGADVPKVLRGWTAFMIGAGLAALVNPHLIAGATFPLRMVRMQTLAFIGEWQAVDFSHTQPLEIALLLLLGLGLTGRVRLPALRLLMILGLVHGALTHQRNGQLFGLVGALILAQPLGDCLGRGAAARARGLGAALAPAAAALMALLATGARLALPLPPERTGAAFAAVLAQVPAGLRARPVLNQYELGGLLIFNGVRPFIDSRADLYGDDFLNRYDLISRPDRKVLEQALADNAVAWTIFRSASPVAAAMDEEPGWRRLVQADGLTVHVRDGPVPH